MKQTKLYVICLASEHANATVPKPAQLPKLLPQNVLLGASRDYARSFTGGCDKWCTSCRLLYRLLTLLQHLHRTFKVFPLQEMYYQIFNLLIQNAPVFLNVLPNIQVAPTQGGTPGVQVGSDQSSKDPEVINLTDSAIPEGYKKTKWDFTLEKIDLSKPSSGQKVPKRFFCRKCMAKDVETGYTKCNDLSIHLQSCGKEKEKKFKCSYQDCTASYVRSDNLKQHIAKEHTKKILYTCKKCDKGVLHLPRSHSPIEKSATQKSQMMTIQLRIFRKMRMRMEKIKL